MDSQNYITEVMHVLVDFPLSNKYSSSEKENSKIYKISLIAQPRSHIFPSKFQNIRFILNLVEI